MFAFSRENKESPLRTTALRILTGRQSNENQFNHCNDFFNEINVVLNLTAHSYRRFSNIKELD